MGILAKHNFKLAVRFENEDGRVVPGGPIRGEAEVTVTSKTKITAVRMKLLGLEEVECRTWGTPHSAVWESRKKPVIDRSSQVVFEQSITLFGFAGASGRRGGAELEPGTYSYPFEFTLPGNMAPSVYFSTLSKSGADGANATDGELVKQDSATACISYTATASVVIPYGFDARATVPFTVASVVQARMVATHQVTPARTTVKRQLLVPDWTGWRASLNRCCARWRSCIEAISGPLPYVELQVCVWNAATALEAPVRHGIAALTQDHGEPDNEMVLMPTDEPGAYGTEAAFSPASPTDVVLLERPTTAAGASSGYMAPPNGVSGIPIEEIPVTRAAVTLPEAAATSLPAPHYPQQLFSQSAAAPAPRAAPATPHPTPTRDRYQVLFSVAADSRPRRAIFIDLTLKNGTSATALTSLRVKLEQVQRVSSGSASITRTVPLFDGSVAVTTTRAAHRARATNAPLRPGETSITVTVEVPLPESLLETPDDQPRLTHPVGAAAGSLFLPTMGTRHINVYTVLTVDAPDAIFSEGDDESRLLVMANPLKIAALEDVSNTATGLHSTTLLMPELSLGAETL